MSSFLPNYLDKSSIDAFEQHWNSIVLYFCNTFAFLKDFHNKTFSTFTENTPDNIHFDDFQWELFKVFSFILATNLILIVIVWKIYGKSIGERFMRLSTLKEIEELKASVSKLKLPKEYSPRV